MLTLNPRSKPTPDLRLNPKLKTSPNLKLNARAKATSEVQSKVELNIYRIPKHEEQLHLIFLVKH